MYTFMFYIHLLYHKKLYAYNSEKMIGLKCS